ncbi:PIN domain nuclease [Winogradskya consettensis]|uniref:Ribonuclease VapC2 n=1 Tax=Winogradskya consettensis TaxID=113560 RepID=A0A919SLN4_9ACTN|nr:PIN domain nuclease [Actinoplanes consettensis]GIM74416.1 ribonuclease VapC2 [Actinoplanes consettensis]
MSARRYLGDTSALSRFSANDKIRAAWAGHLADGLIGVCPITELEIFFSAQSTSHRDSMENTLESYCPWVTVPEQVFRRAREVQNSMFQRGTHRSAGPVDLLVAATAELQGLTMLHYDRDFVKIAEVTGQEVQWLAEPGSID